MSRKLPEKMKATQFKKGQSGNPDGARKHDPIMKQLKNLTEEEMMEIGSLVVKGSINELKAISKDPNASALKCMIASVAIKTVAKGDAHALEILLCRLIGKVKDKVEINSMNNTNVNANVTVFDGTKLKTAIKKLESDV